MKLSGILALSVATLTLTGAAIAQDNGYYQNGPTEEVIVTAPNYNFEQRNTNAPPGKLTLSQRVRIDDLDLTSNRDAHELRVRVRETARDICERLRDEIPYAASQSHPCYRETVEAGLLRADSAIRSARDNYRDDYYNQADYNRADDEY